MFSFKGFRLKDLAYKACLLQNFRTDKIHHIDDVTINKRSIALFFKCNLTIFTPYKQGLELRDHFQ